jgi:hypothetical protein
MENGNRCSALLLDEFGAATSLVEAVTADVTEESAHWRPEGLANPIGANFGHVLVATDAFVNVTIRKQAPLFATTFAGRTGMGEFPPLPDPGSPGWATYHDDFHRWAHRARVDLPVLRDYGAALFGSIREWLSTRTYADLERPVDLTSLGIGMTTEGFVFHNMVVGHLLSHAGEIAVLKGLQRLKGYPF